MSEMTLDQVRDWHLETYRLTGSFKHKHMAEVIDAEIKRQAMSKAVVVEAVGCIDFDSTGELGIDWFVEGGVHEVGAGTILLVSDHKITDDEGYGEVYTAPPAASVSDGILETLQAIKEHALYSRGRFAISTQARVSCDDMIALADRGLAMLAAAPKPEVSLCYNCDTELPSGCKGQFRDEPGCMGYYQQPKSEG